MTEDSYQLDGTVRVAETLTYYRYVPEKIYEIEQALHCMSEEEQIKVMKYITRITGKRLTFRALAKKISNKKLFRAMKRMDDRLNKY